VEVVPDQPLLLVQPQRFAAQLQSLQEQPLELLLLPAPPQVAAPRLLPLQPVELWCP